MAGAEIESLVANHRAFLAFLERRVGDRALAEDILQTGFARALGRAPEVEDERSLIAWFYRVLRNAVIDHHRRRGAKDRGLQAYAAELETMTPDAETHAAICRCVSELAATLKPEYAAAIRRIELEEIPVKEFAVEAGITAGNAAVRAHRAREALRGQLLRACGTCAEHGCLDCTCGGPAGHV